MKRRALAAALALAACHAPRRERPPLDSLAGINAAMWPDAPGVVRLSGGVGKRHADVFVDLAAPFSTVTAGCFEEPLVGPGRVALVDPLGGQTLRPASRLDGFSLTGARLRSFEAALLDGPTCLVTLGAPQLEGLALVFDFGDRELHFVPSRSAAQRQADLAKIPRGVLVPLSREPKHDWPLVAARLSQGSRQLAGAFVLSTATAAVRVMAAPAEGAGLERIAALSSRLPPALQPAAQARFPGLYAQRVDVAPGLGVGDVAAQLVEGEPPRGVVGVLGVLGWGQGVVTVDAPAGVMLVVPPEVVDGGTKASLPDALLDAVRAASGDPAPTALPEPLDP